MASVDELYRKEWIRRGPAKRSERVLSLYDAGYQIVKNRILAQNPSISPFNLKKEVARVMYRNDPTVMEILDNDAR